MLLLKSVAILAAFNFCLSTPGATRDLLTADEIVEGDEVMVGDCSFQYYPCDQYATNPGALKDCKALIDIYYNTNGCQWKFGHNWMPRYIRYCDFTGVTCDSEGYVLEIALSGMNLVGQFHYMSMGNFARVTKMNFKDNYRLTGNIPSYFGELKTLQSLNFEGTTLDNAPTQLCSLVTAGTLKEFTMKCGQKCACCTNSCFKPTTPTPPTPTPPTPTPPTPTPPTPTPPTPTPPTPTPPTPTPPTPTPPTPTPPTPTPPTSNSPAITTTTVTNKLQAGNMFDVVATKALTIKEIKIHTNASGKSVLAYVFKKKSIGSYLPDKKKASSWTQVYSKTITGATTGFTNIGSFEGIGISAGSTQALYITLMTEELKMLEGLKSGTKYTSNSDIEVYVGVSSRFPFGRNADGNVWSGSLGYELGGGSSPSSNVLGTTMDVNKAQAGNMFDVVAIKSLKVTNLDIHTSSTTPILVTIYTIGGSFYPSRRTPTSWALVDQQTVTGKGKGLRTALDKFGSPINVMAGSTQGLYVTLVADGLLMKEGGLTTGQVFASNADLKILVGVSSRYAFGRNAEGNLFSGYVGYEVV